MQPLWTFPLGPSVSSDWPACVPAKVMLQAVSYMYCVHTSEAPSAAKCVGHGMKGIIRFGTTWDKNDIIGLVEN